jgi:hypothetical protein
LSLLLDIKGKRAPKQKTAEHCRALCDCLPAGACRPTLFTVSENQSVLESGSVANQPHILVTRHCYPKQVAIAKNCGAQQHCCYLPFGSTDPRPLPPCELSLSHTAGSLVTDFCICAAHLHLRGFRADSGNIRHPFILATTKSSCTPVRKGLENIVV